MIPLPRPRYHGANTPSAWLIMTSYRIAGDIRLDRFGIEDGIWAESRGGWTPVNRRAEIAGMITPTEQQRGQFRADLVHLDTTIRLFAWIMEPKTILAKRIRQSDLLFEQGDLSHRVLDARRRGGCRGLTIPWLQG